MLAEKLRKICSVQPDAIAIDCLNGTSLSYGQLWNYINSASSEIDRLSKHEKYLGIVADQDFYAIIVGIAAILNGKIIIPLDPRLDSHAINEVLKPFTNTIISGLSDQDYKQIITIPVRSIKLDKDINYNFITQNGEAFVMHTSGTTGKPKAVLADRSALYHVASSLAKRYHFDESSRVLQFAYLSFDSSLIEIWSTLLHGGTIIVPGAILREDLYGCIKQLLTNEQFNTITLPPSVASNIPLDQLGNLRTLILAGEVLPLELANKIQGKVKYLINAYGPTESIICATTYEITGLQKNRIPIGKPLPGMQIQISNPDVEGKGEIILSSNYLAKGYINEPYLTSVKFGTNINTTRYYKSGDIGRLREDGNYEFYGRSDNQVKINGQRIEIEGVEASIRAALGMNSVAVIAASNQLNCFYAKRAINYSPEAIISILKKTMPVHLIPNHFIAIDELPIDHNGKIDRRALRQKMSDKTQEKYEILHDNLELNDYIEVWVKSLDIPERDFNMNTTFFALGGDSLKALRLIDEINRMYDVNLRLSEVVADEATPFSILQALKIDQSNNVEIQ